MLQKLFINTLEKYTHNKELINEFWLELETLYKSEKRYYHNLTHLTNLYSELKTIQQLTEDWDVIILALFYHDAIYNTLKTDNEELSAKLAVKRLTETNLSKEQIDRCYQHILATKSHNLVKDQDSNLFTDADLSILGSNWETYFLYTQQIRKEYSIYPNFIYKKGRKKVLNHLLGMKRLYKTDYFFNLYEERARKNLTQELSLL